ncbi:MAG: hypothetical protein KDD61_06220 [Bdellovibrionales bacterium]|nr:hypothetical protein [Bdellovibrionales bacterium]
MIRALTGHNEFKSGDKTSLKTLQCILNHLYLDSDSDGIKDWKIMDRGRMLSHLVPNDPDWDNDQILNFLDPHPFDKKILPKITKVPAHLKIEPTMKHSSINDLQEKLFLRCGILAINHTDQHSLENLSAALKVCENELALLSNSNSIIIMYAFVGHGYTNTQLAAFHPELNAMSIQGITHFNGKKNKEFDKTFLHEIGHYYTFQFLSPTDLLEIASQFKVVDAVETQPTSFFDPSLLSRKEPNKFGFYPTPYSKKNLHEWFSEMFVFTLVPDKFRNPQKAYAMQFRSWLNQKIKRSAPVMSASLSSSQKER